MIVVVMMGRTAAGKTTLGKHLSKAIGARYIPEAALKRALVPSYQAANSLDERLRDLGYAAAAAVAHDCVQAGESIVVDAAHHLRHRRLQILEATRCPDRKLAVIYCRCSQDLARERIEERARGDRNAYTQADSFSIYEHVDNSFEELRDVELADHRPCTVVTYDSASNTYSLAARADAALETSICTELAGYASMMSTRKADEEAARPDLAAMEPETIAEVEAG